MKKYMVAITSGILASTFTLVAFFILGLNSNTVYRIEHEKQVPIVGAAYTFDQNGELEPLSFTNIAKEAMNAVVHIQSTRILIPKEQNPFRDEFFRRFFGPESEMPSQQQAPQARIGSGSGVIIKDDGYIVTNNHVIRSADEVIVTTHENKTFQAKIVGTDSQTDIALLKVDAQPLPTIPWGNSDNVQVGEWVLAVGNPFNLNSTVTAGIVSAKARNLNIFKEQTAIETFIQTDAAVNPGNSGGALVNLDGTLIGINTAIASPTGTYAGYAFAVPSDIVQKVVKDLMEYGVVQRGYLGLLIRPVTGELARERNLEVTQGIFVDSLMKNSGAEKAGIEVGDVIVAIEDKKVESPAELLGIIGTRSPGDKVMVTVKREGKTKKFDVTLQNREGKVSLVEKEAETLESILGIELKKIDNSTARKMNIPGGVRISGLKDGKLKRQTEIREGFIITKINNQPVKSVEDVKTILSEYTGGVMLEGVYENYPGIYYYAFGM